MLRSCLTASPTSTLVQHANKVQRWLVTATEAPEASVRPAVSPYLEVRDVSLWLGRAKHRRLALDRVSLGTDRGRIIGLIGPSGSGKSTLLKAIGGLIHPDHGSVKIDGRSAADVVASSQIGLVFQQPVLLPWKTALQNVLFTSELAHRVYGSAAKRNDMANRARELLELVDLAEHEHKYPRELSGGMQQRVSIARALMTGPSLLLMDEPFSALDEIIRERLNLTLMKIWERLKITIVFVTHSLSEAAFLCDSIFAMAANPGRIIEHIPVEILRPRSMETYRSKEFTDLTMHLRTVLLSAFDEGKSK
jgi:NitT/TauT family transport system ATP-binding protein